MTASAEPDQPSPPAADPIAAEAERLIPRIVHLPHPTLRVPSKDVRRVDPLLKAIVARMFDLMYAHKGVGLAANQVDLPLRLFVVNPAGERGKGEELVFINPVVTQPKGTAEDQEGCLSIPGVYADVKRPRDVRLQAYSLTGQEIDGTYTGMMARIIQHELDHLDGVLFIDRLTESTKTELRPRLTEFEIEFAQRRTVGGFTDESLAERRKIFLDRYA